MKVIVLIIFCLLGNAAYTQSNSFNLSEIEKLLESNFIRFKDSVEVKGYRFDSGISDEEIHIYTNALSRTAGMNGMISKTTSAGTIKFVSLSEQSYLNFQADLVSQSYRFEREGKAIDSDIPVLHYSNGKYHALIYTYQDPEAVKWYCMQVSFE